MWSTCHKALTYMCPLSSWQTCPVCRLSTGQPLQAPPTLASPSVTRATATALTSWPLTTPSWTSVVERSLPPPPPPYPASMSLWRGAMSPNPPVSTRCHHTGPSRRRRRAIQLLRHWRPCPPPPCTLNSLRLPPPPPRPCRPSLALPFCGRSTPWPLLRTTTLWAPAWRRAPSSRPAFRTSTSTRLPTAAAASTVTRAWVEDLFAPPPLPPPPPHLSPILTVHPWSSPCTSSTAGPGAAAWLSAPWLSGPVAPY